MKSLLKKTGVAAGIAVFIYLILFFFFDKKVDIWIHNNCSENWCFQLGTYISFLATGAYIRLAVAICFILIIIIDPELKHVFTRNLLFICICCSIAVVIGEGLKYFLARHRPVMLFEENKYGLSFFSSEWSQNSSPSGHSIRAFAILTALSLLYKRYSYILISIAVLIGASRVIVTAHYPSDVIFGAFIGAFTTFWTYNYFYAKNNIKIAKDNI